MSAPRITAEQLRERAEWNAPMADVLREAADTIEALTAERNEAWLMYQGASLCDQQHLQEAADRINALMAEVARARESES